MVFSNQASRPMEEVAAAMGDARAGSSSTGATSDDLVESLVGRAEACGCEAIVVTLDTTMLGWRTRDLELAYLPFLRGKGIAQYTSDPVFQRLARRAEPSLPPTPQPKPTPAALVDAVPADPALPRALDPARERRRSASSRSTRARR